MQAVSWVPSSTWVREKPEGFSFCRAPVGEGQATRPEKTTKGGVHGFLIPRAADTQTKPVPNAMAYDLLKRVRELSDGRDHRLDPRL